MKTGGFRIYGSLLIAVSIPLMIGLTASAVKTDTAVSDSQLETIYGGAEICMNWGFCSYFLMASCPSGSSCDGNEGDICLIQYCSKPDAVCVGFGEECARHAVYCCVARGHKCRTISGECVCRYDSDWWVGNGMDCGPPP